MKKNLSKVLTVMALAVVLAVPTFASAQAAAQLDLGQTYAGNIGLSAGDPRVIAGNLVRVIMTFLSIIAVVVILLGGFKWMTAGGNEDKVEESKKLIKAGIIGLLIILAAWAIANFVITNLSGAIQQSQ